MKDNTPIPNTVLLVEDDEATRRHLTKSISAHTDLQVVDACHTLGQGLDMILTHQPDVLVTDLGLPDGSGIDLIRFARAQEKHIEIMVITVFGDEHNVLSAIEAGAGSYLLKDGDASYIGNAIMQLLAGESPISAAIARQLLKRYQVADRSLQTQTHSKAQKQILTTREKDVLGCMAKGYTYSEAAKRLGMSRHTVTSHIKNIYRKLEVNSKGKAVFRAAQIGLVDL